ncbi:copper transporter [Corynebacterium uberis]|uniref:copper transporter n=1 Tax=Corynebacterium TaxID=1716 RepID=UPI001D0A14E4|nr:MULTISPECIES: copper transporter [Corynebacterium]MCZ9308719.1 copper transporter [Corynebacterium sp. c6VSa_13]UDL74354.1 copper transporter [Corynebacterium uberis]UDL76813.1 copper transporter [Corynebacterium uberis]UDL79026.1 copper transporter [Corynebacterium uberis]UDL79264.1 copper transporter [Corynebacterium uberis]
MPGKTGGRTGLVVAGLAFGIAAGVAFGTLGLAPNLSSGAGPGAGSIAQERDAAVKDAQINDAQARSADAVVGELARPAVADVLKDHSVLIMRTADAQDEDVAAVRALLRQSGATFAGGIKLESRFLSQDGADALKTVVTNTLPAGAQLSETNLDPGTHAGEALGSALLVSPREGTPQATEAERATVLTALRDGGFISYDEGTISPAQAVLIVTGDSDGSGDAAFSAKTLAAMSTALDSRGRSVVLAGRIHTAADTGAVGQLRAAHPGGAKVSTVDSVDRQWGRVATVLAVRERIDGATGAYGAAASAEAASPALTR